MQTQVFLEEEIRRFLWYCYYIPNSLIPMIGFYSALNIGEPEQRKVKLYYWLMYVPWSIILGFILTNDFHQLTFRFSPNFENWNTQYTYGVVYYAACLCYFILQLLSISVLINKCRTPELKKLIWIPLTVILGVFIYVLLYSYGGVSNKQLVFIEMTAAICAYNVAFWESLIQIGLIPSNINYGELFSASNIGAQIIDNNYIIRYASKNARKIDPYLIKFANGDPVYLDEYTRLKSSIINGGYILWQEDVGEIQSIISDLEDIGDIISGNNHLLAAENQLKKQQSQVAEQLRLYSKMTKEVHPQLEMLKIELAENKNRKPTVDTLAKLCIISAYIKRRCNLFLLSESKNLISSNELSNAIQETMDYLKSAKISCHLESVVTGSISSHQVLLAYDLLEATLEGSFPYLDSIFVILNIKNENLHLKITVSSKSFQLKESWEHEKIKNNYGALSIIEEDSNYYIALSFKKEVLMND